MNIKTVSLGCIAAIMMVTSSAVLAGPSWEFGENNESNMKLSFLGQIQGQYVDTTKPIDTEDFFVRRARIILSGQITDGVKFFAETDNDNAGKNGNKEAISTDIQDAFVDFRIWENQWVAAGMILLPFSFETKSGATSPLGIDYNIEAIKLVNTFTWRDIGAEFHGNVTSNFAYRLGVFDGYDTPGSAKNPEAPLRYTGHIAVNILGAVETDSFFSQCRLGKGFPYISIGAGGDMQDEATLVATTSVDTNGTKTSITNTSDSKAWVVDFQSGFSIPMGSSLPALEVTLNGAYYDWENSSFSGNTMFAETGLMMKKTMLTLKATQVDADGKVPAVTYAGGLHYFMKKQNARAGVEYSWGDNMDNTVQAGIQFLL